MLLINTCFDSILKEYYRFETPQNEECWCKNLPASEKLESGKPRSPPGPAKEV